MDGSSSLDRQGTCHCGGGGDVDHVDQRRTTRPLLATTASSSSSTDSYYLRDLSLPPLLPPQLLGGGRLEQKYEPPVAGTLSYYALCALGGATASSIRWVLNPLEVVKSYRQVGHFSTRDARRGVLSNLRTLRASEGWAGLTKGLGPTAVAYGFQTGTKYALYEYFKDEIGRRHSVESLTYVTAAAFAEFFACVLMCPWEMVRVKVQTATPGASFPTDFRSAAVTMLRNRESMRFPFGALGPLWARQIPGTVVNFYAFENIVKAAYRHVLTDGPKESYGATTQLCVTLASGYLAGFAVGVVSHPADSLISLMSHPSNRGKGVRQIASEVGFAPLLTRGLGPRVAATGTVIGFQWWIYDGFKTALGMGTTGG